MSGLKRKAVDELTRFSPTVAQKPIPRTRTRPRTRAARPMTLRTAPLQPQLLGMFSQAWNWARSLFCPPSYTDMTDDSDDVVPANHKSSSTRRHDGTVTLKRQRTQYGGGTRRPMSGYATASVARTIDKGSIDFRRGQDEKQKLQTVDEFWAPPNLGLGLTKKRPKEVSMEDIDESLGHIALDAAPLPFSSPYPAGHSPQQYHIRTPTIHTHQIPNTPQSLPRTIQPSKSTGNLGEGDSVKNFLDRERHHEGLRIATLKEVQLEVSKQDRQRWALEEKRKARKQRRLTRQVPLKPLIQSLDVKWEQKITDIKYSRDISRILTHSSEGTELRVKDFGTLLGNIGWLNDEIINTYIEWIVIAANKAAAAESEAAGEPVSAVPKFLAHNSFFWNNLRVKGPKSTERLMRRKGAPGKSLLEVDTVFIPINNGVHWTIGIVRPMARTIEYLDSQGRQGEDQIKILTGWVENQLGSDYDEKEWKIPRTRCAHQSNGYDCGVFVCTNALCVALGVNTDCYNQRDLVQQRKNIAAVLLNKGFEGDFRWDIEGFVG